MKLKKTKATTAKGKLETVSSNLGKVSAHAIKTLDRLEKGEITLNQAKVAQRLIADSIRAELGKAMVDSQIITLDQPRTIALKQ